MLLAQDLFLLWIAEPPVGGRICVGSRALAHAASANKDLRLQQAFALASLALHVVDGIAVFHIRVKAENHATCPQSQRNVPGKFMIPSQKPEAPLDTINLRILI